MLVGHTGSSGSRSFNLAIAERRTAAVKANSGIRGAGEGRFANAATATNSRVLLALVSLAAARCGALIYCIRSRVPSAGSGEQKTLKNGWCEEAPQPNTRCRYCPLAERGSE